MTSFHSLDVSAQVSSFLILRMQWQKQIQFKDHNMCLWVKEKDLEVANCDLVKGIYLMLLIDFF